MFTYKWNKYYFYILMEDNAVDVVDYLTKDDATYFLKNDVVFTQNFTIEMEDGIVYFNWVDSKNDANAAFVDKDEKFLSSVKKFLTGVVE